MGKGAAVSDLAISCSYCPAIAFAVAPGREEVRCCVAVLLSRGEPSHAWCLQCWRKAFICEASSVEA
jgi:hypothetical protein